MQPNHQPYILTPADVLHEGLNKHYDVLKNEVILIYKIVLRPSVRPSVYPSVRLNIHHSTRVLEGKGKKVKEEEESDGKSCRKERIQDLTFLSYENQRFKGLLKI